jgi:hypothetical protein
MIAAKSRSDLSLSAILARLTPGVCHKTLLVENSSMLPAKLRLLRTKHVDCKDKPTAFTYIIMTNRLIFKFIWHESIKVKMEMYVKHHTKWEITLLIVMVTTRLPEFCIIRWAEERVACALADRHLNIIRNVPFPNSTASRIIEAESYNFWRDFIKWIASGKPFVVKVNESTDVSTCLSCLNLWDIRRFQQLIWREIPMYKHLSSHVTGEDKFNLTDRYMAKKVIVWNSMLVVA